MIQKHEITEKFHIAKTKVIRYITVNIKNNVHDSCDFVLIK